MLLVAVLDASEQESSLLTGVVWVPREERQEIEIGGQEPASGSQPPETGDPHPAPRTPHPVSTFQQPAVRIGIVRDSAFQFYYPENIDALAALGAEIVYVSPLKDRQLPHVDALYIGGGFPETHAEPLSANTRFNGQLKALAEDGLPIYAECGGLMYLGEQLVLENNAYAMVGILPVAFDFFKRPQGHGYAIINVEGQNPYYAVGTEIRGHEFHYSRVSRRDPHKSDLVFRMQRGRALKKIAMEFCIKMFWPPTPMCTLWARPGGPRPWSAMPSNSTNDNESLHQIALEMDGPILSVRMLSWI